MDIPPRNATDRMLARFRRTLALTFDVDLGELVDGHHVVARGLELREDGAVLHDEFVPAVTRPEQDGMRPFFWYWMLKTEDDLGTDYSDQNGGAFDDSAGGAASHGTRDLGGRVPEDATRLSIRFEPGPGHIPAAAWRHMILVDLERRLLVDD